jgi:tetratricopeptide (TPR) repeat protein
MTKPGLRARLTASLFAALLAATAFDARAQDPSAATREAGKHFDRGVTLYGETDYAGALVEFKRAHALMPNSAVLYNIGEAQYQLQDYAGALLTFTRYLSEAPAGSAHRSEVENDVDVLRTRVGRLSIVTVPPGADVSVDDQPAGKTPLEERLLVSVGHRKVSAVCPGRVSTTRFVDVAADDNLSITLELPAIASAAIPASASERTGPRDARAPSKGSGGGAWRTVGWVATGLFAAGAAGAGGLALKEAGELKAARSTFPASPATLQGESNRTLTYSILADSLTAAAVVVGGITLLSTVTSHGAAHGAEGTATLRVAPTSVKFEATF